MVYLCIVSATGEIKIHIEGKVDGMELKPYNYDIGNLKQMLECVEDLIFPSGRKGTPVVSLEISEGSVIQTFKASKQIIAAFGAILSMVSSTETLDGLEPKTATAFETIQQISRQKGFSFDFSTSEKAGCLHISPETNYSLPQRVWAETEFYFYGKLVNAGGKGDAKIRLDTEEYGVIVISADKSYLQSYKNNLLYRDFAVRAKGLQDALTGDINFSSLNLLEITDYQRKFDADYINTLIDKATPFWRGVDADAWLSEVRGGGYV